MPLPAALTISATDTLALLDGSFLAVANAVANDGYAFWLGSGISRDRMPPLAAVVAKTLEFLRVRSNAGDAQHTAALNGVLDLAALSPAQRAAIDLASPVASWPDLDVLTARLTDQYAKMLDHPVGGQEQDYLVWEAVEVVATYANPATDPDIEHICLGLLILEGVASDLATANWDGLIEKAVSELAGGADVLRVCVRPEDTQKPELAAVLYKFHGCAVLAGNDEPLYRPYIVARQTQIDGWAQRADNKIVADKLIDLATSKPTLMLGLSAQDANIKNVFVAAEQRMNWPYPSNPPACAGWAKCIWPICEIPTATSSAPCTA